MARLTEEQWQAIRAVWENDPDFPSYNESARRAAFANGFTAPVKTTVESNAKKNCWSRSVGCNGEKFLTGLKEADQQKPVKVEKKVWFDDEKSFQSLFVHSLNTGSLCASYELPACLYVATEVKIPGAVIDVVAYHQDGSISIFELKKAGLGLRDYMTGIGQLMHASVQFGLSLSNLGSSSVVRRFLAVPHEPMPHVGFACLEARVDYIPFGTISEHNKIESEVFERLSNLEEK